MEMKHREQIEKEMREICSNWGYEEIQTPTFETLELFTMKSGEEIVEEIYEFKDKSDRELALRPEITASVMRYYSNELRASPKPLKLFYFGNCFRYEQPQKGRYREFWQFGTEVIGGEKEFVEAEIIALAYELLEEVGLEFELKIGHIGILRSIMDYYDLSMKHQNKILSAIDKEEKLNQVIDEINISKELENKINNLKESKDPLEDSYKLFDELDIKNDDINCFEKTLDLLEKYGVNDYDIDLAVTRGLDYYDGTVFELYASGLGAQNQVCGGGTYRFPELLKQNFKSTGFAIGFDRVLAALKEQNLLSEVTPRSLIYVAPLSEKFQQKSIEITNKLRKHFSTEIDLKGRSIGDQLSYANRLSIPFVVLIGEEEIKSNKISLKNMDTGEQQKMNLDKAIEEINSYKEEN